MIERKKRNSSKVNLIVSVVFHTLAIGAVFFFAAREGMLGKKLKQLTVTMVPKEKKPEPPKEKPPEPKPDPDVVKATDVCFQNLLRDAQNLRHALSLSTDWVRARRRHTEAE